MLKKWGLLLLITLIGLAACHSAVYNQTEANVADVKLKAADALRKSDASAKPDPSLLIKQGSYVDTTPVSLQSKPSWLKNKVIIRGDQLPFSYYSRVIATGANTNILTKYQSGLDSSVKITINYSGTVEGALDLLASKTGYVYSVNRNAIYWQAFVTRTFDVAFMPGGTDYMMGKTSSSGGGGGSSGGSGQSSYYTSGDSSDSEYSSLSGKLSIWSDLDATIKQMLSPEGKVSVSQATTSVTVRDRPTYINLIGQYISNLNRNLAKQVLVKVQVLDVTLDNAFDFGINWALIASGFNKSNFVVNGNYGTPISITALTPQPAGQVVPQLGSLASATAANKIPSYTILFNALNQQGKTSIVSEPRVVCLNNQVSVIRIIEQEGYVASIQNTSLGGSSSGTAAQNTVTSQVTPGTLTTGLTLYILPKILGKDIVMQVNADMSTKIKMDSFGPSGSQIQLPNIRVKHFNQRSIIKSGDTLILSGFRQVQNTANANQFLESQALGGKASLQQNKETIILITPILLNGSA